MHRVVKPEGKVLVEHTNARMIGRKLLNIYGRVTGNLVPTSITKKKLDDLYRPYKIVTKQGYALPLIGTIAKKSPKFARALLKMSMMEPVSGFSRVWWIVSQKPVS